MFMFLELCRNNVMVYISLHRMIPLSPSQQQLCELVAKFTFFFFFSFLTLNKKWNLSSISNFCCFVWKNHLKSFVTICCKTLNLFRETTMDVICLKGCDISRYSNHGWCALLPGLQFLTCLDIFAAFRSCVLVFYFFFLYNCLLSFPVILELRYDMAFPCHSRTIALKMSFFFFFPLFLPFFFPPEFIE